MEVTCVSKSLPCGMGNTVILGRNCSLGAHFETDIFILMLQFKLIGECQGYATFSCNCLVTNVTLSSKNFKPSNHKVFLTFNGKKLFVNWPSFFGKPILENNAIAPIFSPFSVYFS